MELAEHKAILNELLSDNIDATKKTELIMKLGDDYGITHATLTDTTAKLEKTTADKDYFEGLSKKLWLENSATLTQASVNTIENTKKAEEQHRAKVTIQDLVSKFK